MRGLSHRVTAALILALGMLWGGPSAHAGCLSLLGAGGACGGAAPITFSLTFGAEGQDLTAQTTYTITGVSIGATDPNRYVPIIVTLRSSVAVTRPTVTIDTGGGPQATTIVASSEQINGGGPVNYAGTFLSSSPLTSGTTATIVISSFGSAAARAAIATYRLVTSSPSGSGANSAASNPTTTQTVPTGGGIIAGMHAATTTSTSMTNLTSDFSAAVGTSFFAAAHDASHTGSSTAYTITTVPGSSQPAATFAWWGP